MIGKKYLEKRIFIMSVVNVIRFDSGSKCSGSAALLQLAWPVKFRTSVKRNLELAEFSYENKMKTLQAFSIESEQFCQPRSDDPWFLLTWYLTP
jgi:hypothetical protein